MECGIEQDQVSEMQNKKVLCLNNGVREKICIAGVEDNWVQIKKEVLENTTSVCTQEKHCIRKAVEFSMQHTKANSIEYTAPKGPTTLNLPVHTYPFETNFQKVQ